MAHLKFYRILIFAIENQASLTFSSFLANFHLLRNYIASYRSKPLYNDYSHNIFSIIMIMNLHNM